MSRKHTAAAALGAALILSMLTLIPGPAAGETGEAGARITAGSDAGEIGKADAGKAGGTAAGMSGATGAGKDHLDLRCLRTADTGSVLSARRYCLQAAMAPGASADALLHHARQQLRPAGRDRGLPEKAAEALLRILEQKPDFLPALMELGRLRYNQRRYEEALELFRRAGEQGHPDALLQLGLMIRDGRGTAPDPRAAAGIFLRAARLGEPRSQAVLREYYGSGMPELNVEQSYFWALAASMNGSYAAASALPSDARRLPAGKQQEIRDQVDIWLGSLGDPAGQCLRLMDMDSPSAAFGFCQRATGNVSDPRIQQIRLILADLLMAGSPDRNPDPARALMLYERAAAGGSAQGAYMAGDFYDRQIRGVTVGDSRKKAAEYFLQAAQQDHQEACLRLGEAYETGRGIPRKQEEALKWLEKAARLGSEEGANRLGLLLAGSGDHLQGAFWLTVAARWGHRTAETALKAELRKLSSREREETEEHVREFLRQDLK